ncbi:MAG: peroxiredoxin family protein [Gaiellaceae bacterium]
MRLRGLVAMQDEIQCEHGRLAVVTTASCDVNGAFRAGLNAAFPFLSDSDRRVATDLDLIEETDAVHRPFLPTTFLLDSSLRIARVWGGFWFWGNPTPEELRQALRAVTQSEQPTFDAQATWRDGSASPAAGIDAQVVWVREDDEGREIWRGAHTGALIEVGAEFAPSRIEGRPWVVDRVESEGGTTAMYLRKAGSA